MKRIIAIILLVCVSSVFAGYTYEIGPGQDFGDKALDDYESLLMTGGMGHFLILNDWSSARIEDTDPLVSEGVGGIWELNIGSYSTLEILGGEIHELSISSSAYATISGGRIDGIRNVQNVGVTWIYVDGKLTAVPDPHITFVCNVDSVNLNGDMLTGNWLDGSGFSIQLVGVNGYDPAIENIQFIPEPASMLLLGLGGLLIRRKK